MDEKLIYGGEATLEDLCRLNQLGFEFVVEDGKVTNVLHGWSGGGCGKICGGSGSGTGTVANMQ